MPSPRPLVLVCDRDGRTARLLARMLRDDGMDAEVATTGADAIARLSRVPAPDALVTDLGVSHTDGAAVARFARSVRPGATIVIVTNRPDLAAGLQATLSPPPVILEKPVDYDQLARALAAGTGGPPPRGPAESAR